VRKGFVDLQVNGYLGVDFSSAHLTLEDCHRLTEALVRAGTVAYCATLITSDLDIYRRNLPLIARAMGEPGIRGHLLGIHLEGPYLSPADGARGAHPAALMRHGDCDEVDRLYDLADGRIALLTVAPEIPGVLELIAHVRRLYPTQVALGHHLASRDMIHHAVDAGASLVTHLGNGCPNLLPRHSNVIVHQLAHDGLTAGVITDGHHLPEDLIRVIFRSKGLERLFIVSDAAPLAGSQPGVYDSLGGTVRLTPGGRIESLDGSHLAGSTATMADCMRHLRSLRIVDDDALWRLGYKNPLAILRTALEPSLLAPLPDFRYDAPGDAA
jgi:N-acetylglucosamine-6-phosphate deacetylase